MNNSKYILAVMVLLVFTFNIQASGIIRFQPDQLQFTLVNNSTGVATSCTHEILTHVPWWKVQCDDRQYTVDTWLQIRSKQDLFENTLLFHVSEGIRSSGTKLVQFKSHMTSFMSRGEAVLVGIKSQLDVRNGQADLILQIK